MTYTFCPRCKGSGYYMTSVTSVQVQAPCPTCKGSGKCAHCGCGTCTACLGSGELPVYRAQTTYHRSKQSELGSVACGLCNGKGTVPQEVADREAGNAC